jgi:hypothetical protein
MAEGKQFKRGLFGGFDRKDVVEYIEKLAGERNALRDRVAKAEEESARLKETIAAEQKKVVDVETGLREELAAANQQQLIELAELREQAGAERKRIEETLQNEADRAQSQYREELAGKERRLQTEISEIDAKYKAVFAELEERYKTEHLTQLDETRQRLSEVQKQYYEICGTFASKIDFIRTELSALDKSAVSLKETLDSSGDYFEALSRSLIAESEAVSSQASATEFAAELSEPQPNPEPPYEQTDY